jgi:hypothetical protein
VDDHDIPINVIILEDIDYKTDVIINDYASIIKDCKKVSELKSALRLIASEIRELTLREILVRDIQSKAKLLEDTKKD